jgi:hypothetical protein
MVYKNTSICRISAAGSVNFSEQPLKYHTVGCIDGQISGPAGLQKGKDRAGEKIIRYPGR